MRAVSPIGRGTALTGVWNGAPALYLGVPTNAAIWKAESYRNIPFVRTVWIGFRAMGNGRDGIMSQRQEALSFLTGIMTVQSTIQALWRNAKTEQFIPLRATLVMPAAREAMRLEAALSMVTVSLPIKKRVKEKPEGFIPLALLPYIIRLQLLL